MSRLKSRKWHVTYDDAMYGIVERTQFNLQGALPLIGDRNLVKRWYPHGPIKIVKLGVQHVATQGGTETTVKFYKNGASLIGTIVCSTDSAAWTVASKSSGLGYTTLGNGKYLSASNTGTVASGSVMLFVDWVRTVSNKHEFFE